MKTATRRQRTWSYYLMWQCLSFVVATLLGAFTIKLGQWMIADRDAVWFLAGIIWCGVYRDTGWHAHFE